MSQPSYMTASGSGSRNRAFSITQAAHSFVSSSVANGPTSNSNTNSNAPPTFKVPAHKHAHHLHSIPPREKSTRTLIIDHMLWVHGRTRFAQARAELGMTDRTGGPSSSNYTHRRRPENYEEDYEVGSDGEDVATLKARSGKLDNPHEDDEDTRLQNQDLPLARSLRLRAEGLEKVVSSMLDQPPPVHPVVEEDVWTPPTSPKITLTTPTTGSGSHPHTLPDGVRLRLALGTMINDLFARSAPPPPFRHVQQQMSPSTPSSRPTFPLSQGLPPALSSISSISAYTPPNQPGYFSSSNRKVPAKPGARAQGFYNAGTDPDTANSPPAFRCPRHLHTGCEICVELKSVGRPGIGVRGRSSSIVDHHQPPSSSRPVPAPTWKGMTGGVIGIAPDGGGVSGWQDAGGIGSGLAAPVKTALRRKNPLTEEGLKSGSGNTKLTELIPRFLRLSALVASELGREAREEAGESSSSPSRPSTSSGRVLQESLSTPPAEQTSAVFALPRPMSPTVARAVTEAQDRTYAHVLRPSREWYMLLAGLLTRAALEGYLSAGWRGSDAIECLFTCGLGLATTSKEEEDEFKEFEPDELPSLSEAVKMLFPGLRGTKKDSPEQEYEAELDERLRKFHDIPPSTPDLSTHMEDLAWQYPAEPVERAAVRFCEAIARWRGKPELETYKKKPGVNAPVTIDSLVHSNPSSPTTERTSLPTNATLSRKSKKRPSIETYFIITNTGFTGTGWSGGKRMRSPSDVRPNGVKRVHVQ